MDMPGEEGINMFARKQVLEENVALPEEEGRDSTFPTKQKSEENEALLG